MNLSIETLDSIEAPEISTGDGITILLVAWEVGVAIGVGAVLLT